MSRYVIWTEDENLEVFVGFDEGLERFFLTIEDARTSTGEAGGYLFHNLDHHPGIGMTLDEVATTLARFGMTLPGDLSQQLREDARGSPVDLPPPVLSPESAGSAPGHSRVQADESHGRVSIQVLSWESAL